MCKGGRKRKRKGKNNKRRELQSRRMGKGNKNLQATIGQKGEKTRGIKKKEPAMILERRKSKPKSTANCIMSWRESDWRTEKPK